MAVESKYRGELVYGSSPSRLISKKEEIMEFVASKGKGCLHPFNALPYEYFEGGIMGRSKSMEMCCRLIDVCDEMWLFGISEGTLIETEYFFRQNERLKVPKPLGVFVKEFDEEWQKYYDLYENRFGSTLSRLSLKNP